MKKIFFKSILFGLTAVTLAACSEPADELTSVTYDRNFSPTSVEAKVRNRTNVLLTWNAGSGVSEYAIQVYANDSLSYDFTQTPEQTLSVSGDVNTVTIEGLMGETKYSFYVMAKSEDASRNSKWQGAFAETDTEQIFKTVDESDIKAESVTLRWTAGQKADLITLTPGDITHTVTADEITAGAATITGLTPETEYTAVLSYTGKTRGKISFKTGVKLEDTDILVKEGDDLSEAISAAPEGYRLVLMPGTYSAPVNEGVVGKFTISKDLSIKGLRASEHPVINGIFAITEGASLDIDQVSITAEGTDGNQVFNFTDAVAYDHFSITNSEVKGHSSIKGFYYLAKSGQSINSITIENCVVNNIICSGGDLFDARSGDVGALNILNSTFYNCATERDVVRDNKKCTMAVTIDHCTFYNVLGNETTSKRFFNIQSKTTTVSFTNNIVYKMNGATNHGNLQTPTFDNNVYYETANFVAYDTAGTEADPQFKDPENGDFTIGNLSVSDKKVGDPRWY